MKNSKQNTTVPATLLALSSHLITAPTQTGPPFDQMAAQFLANKQQIGHSCNYIRDLRRSIGKLTSIVGQAPAQAVTQADVRHAVFQPGVALSTQKQVLDCIKALLNWGCKQGYLSHSPASGLKVHVLRRHPHTILTPSQLQALLGRTNDCECQLYIALSAFTGIRPEELARLSWQDIHPAKDILVAARKSVGCYRPARRIAIIPALDAWLQPFYGCQGQVLNVHRAQRILRRVAKQNGIVPQSHVLRRSFAAYRLALVSDFMQVAADLGCQFQLSQHALVNSASVTEARKFFSLPPPAVGLAHWPQLVAAYLSAPSRGATKTGQSSVNVSHTITTI